MRILVIEDNRLIAKALTEGLKSDYKVDFTHSGRDGLAKATSTPYNLILLDLNLPDVSGEYICRTVRAGGIQTPIIVLTGRDALADKVAMLDYGADDYVTKPFSLEEIQARIRATLRHHQPGSSKSSKLTTGELTLNSANRSLTRQNKAIQLRRKEYDLIEYMMHHVNQSLTRAVIMAHVWNGNDNLWANVVDVHIKHLRDKIDRPFESNLIKTIHGVGYKLDITGKCVANT